MCMELVLMRLACFLRVLRGWGPPGFMSKLIWLVNSCDIYLKSDSMVTHTTVK